MTSKDPTPNYALSTHPMLAKLEKVPETKGELVLIYGFVGKVTEDTVRLHQGPDLRHCYEIHQDEIVYAEKAVCPEGLDLTKLVLYSTTRITYVKLGRAAATLPASALADVVAAKHKEAGKLGYDDTCPVMCRVNGYCICAPVDYWMQLDPDKARTLGVVVL
ncbi:MAG: hypothetical protein ACLQIB_54100 [Isosphaeraceae bacterium]